MIIDAHTHMPSPGWEGHSCFFTTVESAIEYLRKTGVNAALFNTWQGVFAETEDDINRANTAALNLYKKYKGFLYPGAVIHPLFPEISRQWLNRFRDNGFMWVGELVPYKCNIEFNEPAWLSLFEHCAKHGHAVQLHISKSINEVAARFPDMQVICSHIILDSLIELANNDNVWLDISGACGGLTIGGIEAALKAFGENRVLFGTDFTGYEPEAFIARTRSAIDDIKVREKVYSKNITELLAKIGSRPMW